jgi:hypothetical protein
MASLTFPDLYDKVVLIYLKGRPPDDSVLLVNARFDVQGGKPYIMGEFAEGASANDWVAGITTGIAWDCVEQYFLFHSMEDYMNRVSRAYSNEPLH